MALLETAAFKGEAGDPTHVEQVRRPRPAAGRVAEDAVADAELHVLEVGHQDAVFVVLEDAVAHRQPAALEADAGAVAGGHPGARRFRAG